MSVTNKGYVFISAYITYVKESTEQHRVFQEMGKSIP